MSMLAGLFLRLALLCAIAGSVLGCAERPHQIQKDELIRALCEELKCRD